MGGLGTSQRIVCWGEVLWDLFPSGRTLGGAVANVAFHLAALGADVALVSRVGDDALGAEAVARLNAAGVDTSLVQIDRQHPTGQVHVEIEAGEPRYRLSAHAAWEYIELNREARLALQAAAALSVGTLVQRNRAGRDAMSQALDTLAPGATVILDANIRPGARDDAWLRQTLARATVVKVNDAEARLNAELFGDGDALRWLHEVGVELVAVTSGAQGASLSTGQSHFRHPGFAATPGGDNVGAGDGFVAALIHGLLAEQPLPVVLERANRYGAFVASHVGATPRPSPELLAELTRG